MQQKLIYFLLFSIALIGCNELSIKNEPPKETINKTIIPFQKIDSLSQGNICVDLQVGFDNEQVRIFIDDTLLINEIMNTQESIGLAYRLLIDRNKGNYIKLNCISSKISDSFKILNLSTYNGLNLDKKNKKIVIIKSTTPFLYD